MRWKAYATTASSGITWDETSDYVHSHDVITILYDPKNPKKNCYPKAFSAKPMILLYGGIALAVVLVIGAVLYFLLHG